MPSPPTLSPDQKLLVTGLEACALLGVSPDTFYKRVAPEVRTVKIGTKPRYPRVELERWVARNTEDLR